MSQKRLDGFQKPIDDGTRSKVNLAVIKYGETDGGFQYAYCSCGKPFTHPRDKVREDQIDKHIEKRHQGRGVRL